MSFKTTSRALQRDWSNVGSSTASTALYLKGIWSHMTLEQRGKGPNIGISRVLSEIEGNDTDFKNSDADVMVRHGKVVVGR